MRINPHHSGPLVLTYICQLCGEGYIHTRQRRTTPKTCRNCLINRHRWALKATMIRYKGGCCQLCGYDKIFRSLDFHHVNPSGKDFSFGGKHNLGWAKLRQELDKCVCVCRNCHGEIHDAIDALYWGHPDPGILARVDEIHAACQPDPTAKYRRVGWEEFHPKFRKPG